MSNNGSEESKSYSENGKALSLLSEDLFIIYSKIKSIWPFDRIENNIDQSDSEDYEKEDENEDNDQGYQRQNCRNFNESYFKSKTVVRIIFR